MNIPRIPFLSLQKAFRQHGPLFTQHLQKEHGDLFYVNVPLLSRVYFALHPSHIHAILGKARPPLEKPDLIQRALQASFGNGLFTSRGTFWRKQRKLMQPTFHHKALAHFANNMVCHTQTMLNGWRDGQTLSIGEVMHELTLSIVLDALFSVEDGGVDKEVVHRAIHDLRAGLTAFSRSGALMMLPSWFPLPPLSQKRRGERALAHSVRQLIAQRRALGEAKSPPDLLTTLLFTRDAETGEGMSDQQVQDELITLYIAGHDTTAILLAWAWVLLAQNPAGLTHLHHELHTTLQGRPPTVADLPQLRYTRGIVKETLRLYPPAWYLFRQAPAGFELDGVSIPAGSMLFLMPITTHHDSRWYDDPETFRPERWTSDFEKALPKGAYFPFGTGPRVCIGNGFALMEAQLILATIAQQYSLEQLNQATMNNTPTLGFAEPVHMQLKSR